MPGAVPLNPWQCRHSQKFLSFPNFSQRPSHSIYHKGQGCTKPLMMIQPLFALMTKLCMVIQGGSELQTLKAFERCLQVAWSNRGMSSTFMSLKNGNLQTWSKTIGHNSYNSHNPVQLIYCIHYFHVKMYPHPQTFLFWYQQLKGAVCGRGELQGGTKRKYP